MYKLAIFDFDGTLVDSAPGIVAVMRQVVEEYRFPHTILEEWKNLVGVPLMRQCEIIFPDRSEEFWLEVATRYRAIYDTQAIEICPLFPTLKQMLERLKQEQIKITIASSKRRYLISSVLDHHNPLVTLDQLLNDAKADVAQPADHDMPTIGYAAKFQRAAKPGSQQVIGEDRGKGGDHRCAEQSQDAGKNGKPPCLWIIHVHVCRRGHQADGPV